MSAASPSGGSTASAGGTNNAATDASSASVWSSLLAKAMRKGKENNATLIVLGNKHCGKTALLNRFSDRVSADVITLSAAAGGLAPIAASSSVANAAGEAGAGAATAAAPSALLPPTAAGEYAVSYSYAAVKHRWASAGAPGVDKDRDEALARLHIWQLDDPTHIAVLPAFLQANRGSAAPAASSAHSPQASITSVPTPTSSAASNSSSPDLQSLQHAVIAVCFDMSEPWSSIDTLQKWLDALERELGAILSQLPASQAQSLRTQIASRVQGYHAPVASADGVPASRSERDGETGALSPTASGTAPAAAIALDPSIPAVNLGVPLLLVGCKADAFSRHLGRSGAAAPAGVDDKFEALTRRLRALAIRYGAGLITTSAAAPASGSGSASTRAARDASAAAGNVELLQSAILNAIYQFPLGPTAPSTTASDAKTPTTAAGSAPAASPTSAAAPSPCAPKVVAAPSEGDMLLWVPSGFDSASLLAATARVAGTPSAGSSTWSDTDSLEEVFRGHAATGSAAAAASSSKKSSKQAGGQQRVQAEDNSTFFRTLKYALEQQELGLGLGSINLTPSAGAGSFTPMATPTMPSSTPLPRPAPTPAAATPASAAGTPAAAGVPRAAASPSPSPSPGTPLPVSTPGSVGGSAAAAATPGSATAAAAGVPGGKGGTGTVAVKQFFKSLLNNAPKPEGGKAAAAQQKAVRANAEKELARMTQEPAPQ